MKEKHATTGKEEIYKMHTYFVIVNNHFVKENSDVKLVTVKLVICLMQDYSRTGGRRGFADLSVSGAVLARIREVTEIKIF